MRKVLAESQKKSRLKSAVKHQSPKMHDYACSPGYKVLLWREKIMNNRIGEFIALFTVRNCYERSKIVAIDQDGVIKRYSTSQIRPFLEQPSMPDNSITERKIEEHHAKTDNDPKESEYDGDNVQLNVGQQSYG